VGHEPRRRPRPRGGERLQISGRQSTDLVHRWRAHLDALIVSVNTVIMDDRCSPRAAREAGAFGAWCWILAAHAACAASLPPQRPRCG
jgi:hypothetical protein